tara:strand:+ start:21691 stop:22017 length:327 start_codon:yes stop_codon:yes gene_type:complete
MMRAKLQICTEHDISYITNHGLSDLFEYSSLECPICILEDKFVRITETLADIYLQIEEGWDRRAELKDILTLLTGDLDQMGYDTSNSDDFPYVTKTLNDDPKVVDSNQ